MNIEPKIFKAYDIRGLSPSEVHVEVAEAVGRALVAHTGATLVVVGRDMRGTSGELTKALIRGVVESGADVITVGLVSTPLFNFAVNMYANEGSPVAGAMITASHNPKEYNGIKMVSGDLTPIGEGTGMEKIRELVLAGKFEKKPEGTEIEGEVIDDYVAAHLALLKKRDIGKYRVVIDAGNGMAGAVTPHILDAYGIKATRLFFNPDGSFPNHEPNPIKLETLEKLIATVREQNADIGVAFDGDADRVGFVDETGRYIPGDIMTALFATELLKKYPRGRVIYTVPCSRAVSEAVTGAGGIPEMIPVGSALAKHRLRETDAILAGELSTHYMFKDMNGVEATDYAMLLALSLMHRTGKKLSELVAPLMRYHHSPEINFEVRDKAKVLAMLEEKYAPGSASVTKIDGIRIDFPTWWFNVRASNTEPLVRLNVEAGSENEMEEKIKELSDLIKIR